MKSDITTREDVKFIIIKFYDKLLDDVLMFPFFEDIVENSALENHFEIITDFWCDILFHTNTYKNNTMQKHIDKGAFISFKKEHFAIWLKYLNNTIDTFFEGANARNMKIRAQSIATVMQLKMNVYNQ
ncbi:group III truncated hemoglobin [Tenacibaculum sp. UWU-22]|uniref:group III truncated hemoglobin n=1 Tax=Tenacibaculum sp. UWU-22 TaxID=3234187 RepID=UPI0034DAF241